jgi:hypothetical protein
MNDITTRINDLVIESTQTALDGAYLAQRQNAQLLQSWYQAFEGNQQASRDIVGRLIKQGQEGRALWLQWVQASYRATAENFAHTAESQLREASEQISTVTRQAPNSTKTDPKPASK